MSEKSVEQLRKELYEEYKKGIEDGTETVVLDSYDEWLNTAYTDEGYFWGHVDQETAKFLIENDPMLDLDYYAIYHQDLSSFFKDMDDPQGEVLSVEDYSAETAQFEYITTGDIWSIGDELISRSEIPDILEELCKEYNVAAETYEEFMEKMSGDISDTYGFYIDAKNGMYEASMYMRLHTPHSITNLEIPLSEKEQHFVINSCKECFERETKKNEKKKEIIERD